MWLDSHVPSCAEPGGVYWNKYHPGAAHREIMMVVWDVQGCKRRAAGQCPKRTVNAGHAKPFAALVVGRIGLLPGNPGAP